MGDIIRLQDELHDRTQGLLPWYVNGTLDAVEREAVDAHLALCEECAADVRRERALAAQIAELGIDSDHGWEAMRERMTRLPPRASASVRLLRRPVSFGWVVGAQLAAAALILAVLLPNRPDSPTPTYHVLGAAPTAKAGNLIVQFGPEVTTRQVQAALTGVDARIVDGPTVTGAYVLHVTDAARTAALTRLRGTPGMVLAEPIDESIRP
jgi:anti-sigma factor RsiW